MSDKKNNLPYYRHYAAEDADACILIVPGYADHAGRYGHVGEYFSSCGIDVYTMDLIGHGNSPGKRGHINDFSEYRDDVVSMAEFVRSACRVKHHYLMGHSLGGLVVTSTVLEHQLPLSGVILSSPFVGLSMPVPPLKVAVAGLVSKVFPTMTMANNIPAHLLSRDSSVGEAYLADPLVFRTATARWFTEAMDAMREVFTKAEGFAHPCLMLQAGDERIADKAASQELFAKFGTKDKTYKEYQGFYHEILNEIGKESVFEDITRWMREKHDA